MSERREPVISNLKPGEEDSSRRRQSAQPPQITAKQPRTQQQYATPAPVQKSSSMGVIAFLFALVGIGLAGFSYWQLMEAKKVIAAADVRIQDLESKFELSDDESTASVTAIQAKVKWADSEIRKLWGVAFDTNRKNIASNESALKTLKKSISGIERSGKATEDKLGGLDADIKLVNDLVDAQQSSLSSIEKQSKNAANAADSAKKANDDIKARVSANEEAVESFDAFRRTVNQRLLQGSNSASSN